MNAVVEIVSDEIFDTVWAIDEQGVARGKSEVIVTGQGRNLSYITIFGDSKSPKNLVFSLGNQESREPTSVAFDFNPNMMLGSIESPVILDASETGFNIYPNSFENEFHLVLEAKEKQVSEIRLYDIMGHEVYKQRHDIKVGTNNLIITPSVQKGLYILRITYDDHQIVSKVLKR